MSHCAYCGSKEQITREHIWPRCIIERVPSYKIRYSAKAGKIIRSDMTVKDVCRTCNNGSLSELDAYFCGLYDAYFNHEVRMSQPIVFKYDFAKLTRALLKIAYNSSRTTDIDADVLQKYAAVIITPDTHPLGAFIKLVTIHSAQIEDRQKGKKTIPATAVRSGPFVITNRDRTGLAARIVQIDSYRFYLLVTDDIANRTHAVRYMANDAGTWLSRSGETVIPAPALSALTAFEGIQNWR